MDEGQQLDDRAAAGDVEAMTRLGKLALAGRGGARSPQDGARLLLAAAEKGSAEADAFVSVIIAVDATEPKDWSLALGYLLRSAERGWPAARDQLRVLAADRALAQPADEARDDTNAWAQLRAAVDLARLLNPRPVRPVSQRPRIGVIENFAGVSECEWMMARGRERMGRAEVFDQAHGGSLTDESRTNSAMMFGVLDMDFVLAVLRARIAASTRSRRASLEDTNVLHYTVGQAFARHYDFYDPALPANAAQIAEKGQRIGTFLVYLNEDYGGGETDFPETGFRYRGKPGDALFFLNVDANGRPDPLTMHAGLPPLRGEKWLLSQWIRGLPGGGL
jgi:prolyl 4-hydroxylase